MRPVTTSPQQCTHRRYRCLQCGNVGCEDPRCPAYGFQHGICRSCGHIEKVPD
jgi:hypothetical protein